MTLLSYHSDENLKDMFVAEIIKHRKADQILQGTYGTEESGKWKGCAVGCSIHSLNIKMGKSYATNDHSVYEKALGIPEWLARLEDALFEGLSVEESKKWPEKFAQAIPVGVNLERVKWQFCSFILKENIERVLTLNISDKLKKQVVESIQGVLVLHKNALQTGVWNESAADYARSVAESAWSAADSARSAAWSAAYTKYAKELLKLLKKAK